MRVAVFADYREERWPSMDLCAEMLTAQLNELPGVQAALVRPRFRRRASLVSKSKSAANFDRMVNRYLDYALVALRTRGFDFYHLIDHSYAHLALALPQRRTVITCHDTDCFRCLFDPAREPRPWWFRALIRISWKGVERAAQVVAVSEATAAALQRDGARVVPNGVHPLFSAYEDAAAEDYLLHVGSTIPRKRVDVLLKVLAEVRKFSPKLRLLRAGAVMTAEQRALARDLGVADAIEERGPVATGELAQLYRRAAAVLVTSDAEGFGLPVIEAMACGCPVVASDLAALRETGGNAAIYSPVGDITRFQEGVMRAVHERASLRAAGIERAKKFTWAQHAREVLAVYRTTVTQQNTYAALGRNDSDYRRRRFHWL